MIKKDLPGFSFQEPKNRNIINIRFNSINIGVGTRRLRTIWTPELAQDLQGYHAIDAEAELTAMLGNEIANEIDRQIIQDLNDNQRFYTQNAFNNILINQPIGNLDHPHDPFNNLTLPLIRRVAARTIGLDLVNVQPLNLPTGMFNYLTYQMDDNGIIQPNYTVLPNEDGWYADGTFESIMIKMDMKPHKFIQKLGLRRGRR